MSVISSLMVKIGADSSGLKKELSNAQAAINSSFDTAAVNKFSSHVEQSAKQVEGLIGKVKTFAAVAAAGFGLSSFIKGTAEAGDNLYRLSQRMHITAAEAGMLSKIMSLTGGDVGSLSTAMMRLDKSFTASSEDGEKTRQILSAVGVSLTDTTGRLLPINEQLKSLAEGYKKATAAGYGQEFVMNTLGVRGMALVSTLEQYNEAAEAAGKVKSVGMDPKAMHELNMQLKIMQMEAGQISTAMVLGFGPILQEFLPGIMTGLQQTALFLKENKTEIAGVTKAAVEFYAVMKGISILGKAAASMQAFWASIRVSATQTTAVEVAASNELTAKQIANINKVVARSEAAYLKMQNDAIKAAQKEGLASDEARMALEKNLLRIQIESEAASARIRLAFEKHFRGINVAAAEMAAGVNASLASTAKGTATATAGEAVLTKAIMAEGAAATTAGAANVAAKTNATKSTVAQTAATTALTTAHIAEGNAAATAGAKSVAFSATAIRGVKALQAGVLALTGGWIGLAAAIAYAGYCLYEYKSEEMEREKANTYHVDGQAYEEKNGYFYTKDRINPDWQPDLSNEYSYLDENRIIKGGEMVTDEALNEKLQSAWWERHKDDEDYKAQLEKEAAEKRLAESDAKLAELMQNLNAGDVSSSEKASSAVKDVSYKVDVPIGEDVVASAMNHLGESWGENTCSIFASAMLEEAGIYGLSDPNGDNMAQKAGAAYHDKNDGYMPKAGDIIEWGGHVGIYDGAGGYIASNTKTGIHHGSMEEAEDWFGPVEGYISTAEYTGNQTVTKTMGEDAKRIEDAVQKLNKAKEDAARLFASMENEIGRETESDYAYQMDQLDNNIRKKQLEINEIKAAGADVTLLESELSDYKSVLEAKIVKSWKEANEDIISDTAKTVAEVESDYRTLAEEEYRITMQRLERERENKEKEILRSKEDAESMLNIDRWYAAEAAKAMDDKTKAIRASFQKTLNDLRELGDLAKIKVALQSDDAKNMMVLQGQQAIADQYIAIWKEAHKTNEEMVADLASSVNSNLASTLKNFIQSSATAMDVIHNLGNTILSTIAEIVAKKAAAQMVTSIFGISFSHGGELPGFASGGALAGGLIEGAGTGTSDSILAYLESTGHFVRLSDGEFVMTAEATKKNRPMLEAMNKGAFKNGGAIYAPSIPGGFSYTSAGNSASQQKAGIIVNITNNTDSQVTATEGGFDQQAQRFILDVVIDGAQRNVNGFGSNLRTMMGS